MIAKSARHLDLDAARDKLLAKPRDQHFDGGLIHLGADAIDMIYQLRFRDQPAIPLDKAFKSRKFLARQLNVDTVMRGKTTGRIDCQPSEPDLAFRRFALAPEKGAHPRIQLFHLEGFDKIVICAGIQPGHPVGKIVTRGQHQDWQLPAETAYLGQNVEPGQLRQVDVQNAQIEAFLGDEMSPGLAIMNNGHGMALILEPMFQCQRQRLVILDGQNTHGGQDSSSDVSFMKVTSHSLPGLPFRHLAMMDSGSQFGKRISALEEMMKKLTHLVAGASVAFGLTVAASLPAAAVDFSGKTIEWTIPFSETGGSAKWANFFAPLLSENLPGNPTVVVKFMPGAGSTKGANWFQKQKHSDGTVMFGSSGSTQFPYLLGDPRVRYEYGDWNPIMASGTGGVAYLNAEDAAKFDGTANNLKGKTFVYGNQGATRLDLIPALAWKMLGMDVEHVMGVKGRGDGRKMFESGEATIDYQTSSAFLKNVTPLVEEGKAVPMMTWGALGPNGDIVRDPTFPDMPTFKEVCNATDGCETSGAAWDAWKAFFIAGFPSQKIAFLPAGTPQDVMDAYTKAFAAIAARSDFAEISAKRLGKYPMYVGADSKSALAGAITVSDSAKDYVTSWLQAEFGVSLN